jgi:HSP20 family molecular chaperone IbpA
MSSNVDLTDLDWGNIILQTLSNVNNDTSDTTSRYLRRPTTSRPFIPECDIVDNENEFTIYMNLAGVNKSSINIEFQNNKVTVSGERIKNYDDTYNSRLSNIHYGRFQKIIKLPFIINNPSNIVRNFIDGMLCIKILLRSDLNEHFTLNVE